MTESTTRVLTAHVPLPLAQKVDQLASRLDRSRGWIIKQALLAWIEQQERNRGLPPGTLGEVNSQGVAGHENV
ncbi:ribbon-helix-helix domain-containing protein [Paraburkholderia sp. IW21]|uniref:ribbon-helix-helix domain-containing protein n=1 Tax=Paraburkholderia sp. IW21 TaxID=3242488 RepID=UPI003522160F